MSTYKEYMNRITVDEAQHEALMTALREASAPVTDVLNEDRSLKRKKKPGFVLLIRRASLAAAAVLLMLLLPRRGETRQAHSTCCFPLRLMTRRGIRRTSA